MGSISASELRLWPLIHGSITLYENCDRIRQDGLVAPEGDRKGLNTFSYDMILNRNNYVFLAPARLKGGYGSGNFLLIDPAVLRNKRVRFSLRDIGKIITQIEKFLSNDSFVFPYWVKDPTTLEEIIVTGFTMAKKGTIDRGINSLIKWVTEPEIKEGIFNSELFKDYIDKYYLSKSKFFSAIENKSIELKYTFSKYLVRDHLEWPFSEEILIPQKLNLKFILGLCDGTKYIEWKQCDNVETHKRVKDFVEKLNRLNPMSLT